MSAGQVVMANAEFVLWSNEQLKYACLKDTIEKLQKMNKIDLGRLFNAYQNKVQAPQHLVYQRPETVCCVCRCMLSRHDVFMTHLSGVKELYCNAHRPINIVQERKEPTVRAPPTAECPSCGKFFYIVANAVPWVPRQSLEFLRDNTPNPANVCYTCYDKLFALKPYEKPKVKFETEDL